MTARDTPVPWVKELLPADELNVRALQIVFTLRVTVPAEAMPKVENVVLALPPMLLLVPVKFTVPLPAVNAEAPLLFSQLPPTLIVVAVPASNVPADSVKSPLTVNAVVLPPTLSV